MLKLLTLKGALNGSAVLDTAQSGTGFELRCRGGLKTLRQFGPINVYLVSDAGISKAECEGMRGRSELPWAGGLIITGSDGKTLCEGSSGLAPKALENAKASIRLKYFRAADGYPPADRGTEDSECGNTGSEGPQETPKCADVSAPKAKRAASPVTERILDSARVLFSREAPPPAPEERKEQPEHFSEPARTTAKNAAAVSVRNPFPRFFPGAEWRLAADGITLEGTAVIRGVRRKLTAYPCGAKPKPDPSAVRTARLRGRNGKVYTVFAEEFPLGGGSD